MAQTQLNIRVDGDDKRAFEDFCSQVGMNTTVAINMYIKNVIRTNRLPFAVEADPFYSAENMSRLDQAARDASAGRHMAEHDLIEVD